MSESDFAASRRAILQAIGGAGLASLTSSAGAAGPDPAIRGMVLIDNFLDEAQRTAAAAGKPADCTDAFARALATAGHVIVGRGDYALNGLRLPGGSTLQATGGAVLHQAVADRPAIEVISDYGSGQLADIRLEGLRIKGHPASRTALVRVEARGAFAIWRSHFAFFAQQAFRALEVQASDANNVFECAFEIVSEGSTDTAILVRGGVYNRYHLFLTQTQKMALDDSSNGSSIRVVAENCVIVRGQNNQIVAHVEGISATKAGNDAAITDQGFGNTFLAAEVNLSAGDRGKLRYAFRAFERSVFINPQIIGEGSPLDPFAPTANLPFTVINGRSRAGNKVETVFDGSDANHDPRNITFIGDVRDFTARPVGQGSLSVQRFIPTGDFTAELALDTQVVIIAAKQPIGMMRVIFASELLPTNGATLHITTASPIAELRWPQGSRYTRLPNKLAGNSRLQLIYQQDTDQWFLL